MGMDNVIEGSVRYTRQGYRCKNCGFNFVFDFTSPDFQCPKCGRIINDKGAYYISRVLRALGIAFAVMLILSIPGIIIRESWVFVPAGAVAMIVLIVLIIQQMWSLLLIRVLYRAILVFLIVALVLAAPAFALQAMNWYQPDGPMLTAAILVVSLILTIVSLLLFKINTKTYDYHQNANPVDIRY
jgi:DNA-directed RNA polymerase subunit RPC12/RpoP